MRRARDDTNESINKDTDDNQKKIKSQESSSITISQMLAETTAICSAIPITPPHMPPSLNVVAYERRELAGLCPEPLIDAICNRALDSGRALKAFDFTDVLRTAAHNEYLRVMLDKHWHLRPLPIRRNLSRTLLFPASSSLSSASGGGGGKLGQNFTFCRYLVLIGQHVELNQVVAEALTSQAHLVKIRSEMSGRVTARHSHKGAMVKTGSPLLTFDGQTEIHLHDHQIKAMRWMSNREKNHLAQDRDGAPGPGDYDHGISGGILKLEMGLGKTLLAIAYSLIAPRPIDPQGSDNAVGFPTLIVSSKAVMAEWQRNGFQKFFHLHAAGSGSGSKEPNGAGAGPRSLRVLFFDKDYMKPSEMEKINRQKIVEYDFVVVSYDTVCAACKKGKFHEVNLELDANRDKARILAVHPRRRDQSDDPRATGSAVLFKTPWERVFADESTRFVNPSTKTYQYMMAIYGRHKYCLSGSPIVNNCTDIWAQFRFCGYRSINRAGDWSKSYEAWMSEHQLTRFILSMDYDNTSIELPPIHRINQRVVLDIENTLAYDYVKKVARQVYDQVLSGAATYAGVLKLLTRLRQTCIAPYLMLPEAKRTTTKSTTKAAGPDQGQDQGPDESMKSDIRSEDSALQRFFAGRLKDWVHNRNGTAGLKSPKLQAVVEIVDRVLTPIRAAGDDGDAGDNRPAHAHDGGDKIVVFSMFTTALDLLRDALAQRFPEIEIVQVDGQVTDKTREALLQQFRISPRARVLLMTSRVGAFGLNLTEANHVIFLDIWWNSVTQKQAERRVHRPGQTKPVFTYTLITERRRSTGQDEEIAKKTVEDRILELCQAKSDLADTIFLTAEEAAVGNSPTMAHITIEEAAQLLQ